MRRLKLAMVVPGGVDPSGEYRVIPCLLWIIQRLARRHEVHVFALEQDGAPSRFDAFGAHVHVMRRRGAFETLARIFAEHRRRRLDVVHAFWAGRPGAIAAAAGRILRRPTIVHVAGGELIGLHDIGYGGSLRWTGRAAASVALRACTSVTAASGPICREVVAFGRTAERLPLGVDLESWREKAPKPRDTVLTMIHVGSLNRIKDQLMALDACCRLERMGLPFHAHFVGADTLGGEVQERASELKLGEAVTFHGFLSQNELRPLVERAHLHVVSSRHEAGPVAMREAAVVGVPTVGTDVGHVSDWAPDAAVAVPVGDAVAMAAAIRGLYDDDEHRLAVARVAQERALREDADWTVGRIEALYEEILAE